jgi:hypothetical protein
LRDAISSIPGAEKLSAAIVDRHATLIVAAANSAWEEELPRARPASQKATDAQLAKLHDLGEALAAHIDNLNQPAVAPPGRVPPRGVARR